MAPYIRLFSDVSFRNFLYPALLMMLVLFSSAVCAGEDGELADLSDLADYEYLYDSTPETGCFLSHTLSTSAESNDNIYQGQAGMEKDTIMKWGYSGEIECLPSDKRSYNLTLDYEKNNFSGNHNDDYYGGGLDFEYRGELSEKKWIGLKLVHDKVKTGNDGLSYYEMSADNTEWEAYYGLKPGKDSTGEFFVGSGHKGYDIYASSNKEWRMSGVRYTHNIDDATHAEVSWEKSAVEYKNEFLIGYSSNGVEILETGVGREDDTESFSIALTRTISIFPMKLVQVSAGKTDNTSNSTEISMFDYDRIITGYDNYDDSYFSIYYMRDIDDKLSMSLYYLRDEVDYPNYEMMTEKFQYGGSLETRMDYYYALLECRLKKSMTLEFSGALIKNRSNESYMEYRQKVYSAGMKIKL